MRNKKMSEDFDTVLRSQYSPGSTTLLYRRQLWLLRLKTTIGEKNSVKEVPSQTELLSLPLI